MNHPIELIGFYDRLRSMFATYGFHYEYNDDLPELLQTLSSDFAVHYTQEHRYHDWQLMTLRQDQIKHTLDLQLYFPVYSNGQRTIKREIVTLSFGTVENYRTFNPLANFGFEDEQDLLDIGIGGIYITATSDVNTVTPTGYRCCITLVTGLQISFRFTSFSFSMK